ncbi:MAG: hypothetical protein LBL33_05955 [Tannerella sp.]|nr:hypothetical protein [Tannerella sp.]
MAEYYHLGLSVIRCFSYRTALMVIEAKPRPCREVIRIRCLPVSNRKREAMHKNIPHTI